MPIRVLVVDDEEDVIYVVKNHLLLHGFEVVTANDGFKGMTLAMKYRPDIIILDVMMPKMSGFQVCANLRKLPEFEETPIIFLTAKDTPQDEAWGVRSGASRYMTKPFDTRELTATIRETAALIREIKNRESIPMDSDVKFEG
jgi:two-component system alkaline phosphatase synthesis response regulator PhoP